MIDARHRQVFGEPKGFLEGVAATSHPAFIDEIGGSWRRRSPTRRAAWVWDANIITSRRPGTALEWSLCCVEADLRPGGVLEVAGPMVTQPATLPRSGPSSGDSRRRRLSRVEKYANYAERTRPQAHVLFLLARRRPRE